MKAGARIASGSLALLMATPIGAQRSLPIGVLRPGVAADTIGGPPLSNPIALEHPRELSMGGGIVGGALGAVVGAFFGIVYGAALPHNDYEPLFSGLIGESIGAGAGTHLGSGAYGSAALTMLTSLGITTGAVLRANGVRGGLPVVLLIPAAQIAASLMVEAATSRRTP